MNKSLQKIIALAFVLSSYIGVSAQTGNFGIGTNAPDASAVLHLDFTLPTNVPRGFLAPRMTSAQRLAILSPANGLLVYQTDVSPGFYFNYGTPSSPSWVRILESGSGLYLALAGGTMAGRINMNDSIITNIGNSGTNFLANGGLTLANALTVSSGGMNITGASVITGALTGLTGITSSGTITFSGLSANQFVKTSSGGVLTTGTLSATDLPLANGYIYIGNATGQAVEHAVTGEATISGTGAVTLDNNSVINKVLNGYVVGTNSTIAAGDNILGAFEKTQGQINGINSTISALHPALSLGTPSNGLSIVAPTQVLSLGLASTSNTGALSNTDWNKFNNKIDVASKGNLSSGTSVITVSGGDSAVIGAGASISISKATTGTDGYLSKDDWNTFNGKEGALTKGNLIETASGVLTITGGTGAVIGGGATIEVKKSDSLTSGYLSSGDWTTFHGKEGALTKGNLIETASGVLTITGGTGAVIGGGATIEVKKSDSLTSGYLSSGDWTTFNNKQGALTKGNLSETASGVLTITGGTGAVIGGGATIEVKKSDSLTSGYLSSGDWTTFNNKQGALTKGNLSETASGVLTITGGVGAVIGGGATIEVKKSDSLTSGYLSSGDWTTFNNKQGALTKGNLSETTSGVLTITGGTGAVIGGGATIEVKKSDSLTSGYLSSGDWTTFNNKQGALTKGNLSETTSGVLTITGGTGAVIGGGATIEVKKSDSLTSGYLSSGDWTTFNNKLSAFTQSDLKSTTSGVSISGTGKVVGSDINISIQSASSGQDGLLSSSDWIKFNNKINADTILSANVVLADGAGGKPTFRALTDADIPDNLTASNYLPLAGGNLSGALNLTNANEIRFSEPTASGTNYSSFKAQAQSADILYTLPSAIPTSGTGVLQSDNSGSLSWATIPSLPSGVNKQTLAFNGTSWDSSSVLLNDGTNIGIGFDPTDTIKARLEVVKPLSGAILELSSSSTSHGDLFSVLNDGKTGFKVASPNVQVDIDGGIAFRPSDVTASNGMLIVPGNRSYIRVTSSTLATSCVITLDNGLQAGQILVLQSTTGSTNGAQINAGSNLKISGPFTLDNFNTLSLVWDGSEWVETGRSNN